MPKLIDRDWVSRAPKLRHVAPFDGIRGVGVMMVMVGHALPKGTLSWAAWVDVFFVLSGFLITTLLLQEHRNTGRVDVRKFYARRLLRLLPALYVMLIGTGLVVLLIEVTGAHVADPARQTVRAFVKEAAAAVLYVYNWAFPARDGPWVDHLWTLSVEEQFYIVVGLVALLAIVRGGIRLVAAGLVIGIAAVQLSRFAVAPASELAAAVWIQRPDALMVGVLGAIVSAAIPDPITPRVRRVLLACGWVAVVVFPVTMMASTGVADALGVGQAYLPDDWRRTMTDGSATGLYWIQWGHSVAVWCALAFTLCAFRVSDWGVGRLLSAKWLVTVGGMLSYSLYIWHVPVQTLVHAFLPDLGRIPSVVLGTTLPFLVAVPSYRYVELRALRLKDRFAVEVSKPVPASGEGPA